jgi:FkbM family methyltransferase
MKDPEIAGCVPSNVISLSDKIFSYVLYLRSLIRMFVKHHRTYSNFFSMLLQIIRKKYPIHAILRNGKHVTLHDRRELFYFDFTQQDVEFDFDNDAVTIQSLPYVSEKKIKIKLYGAKKNGDAYVEVFLKKEYQYLPVKDRTVIDIGANIGDSAIYFALCGADKVIALEPFPTQYKIAKKNIELNNLSDKITLLLAGCGGNTDCLVLPNESDISSHPYQFSPGNRVPIVTLENILKENNVPDGAIMKMDCEGYEYDIILQGPCDTLRRFSYIQIEYHSGYKNLKQKLEECNFSVSVSRPRAWFLFSSYQEAMITKYPKQKWQYLGYIYAKRN